MKTYLRDIVDLPELEIIAIRANPVYYPICFASIFAISMNDPYISMLLY